MALKEYPGRSPLLFGYDPEDRLPNDHFARLVEQVVETCPGLPRHHRRPGQAAYDARLLAKVLIYAYATGERSSRQIARLCNESLPYLFLTRGAAPCFKTFCSFRLKRKDVLDNIWMHMVTVSRELGVKSVGHIFIDSTKIRANASPESVIKRKEFDVFRQEFERILAEADEADARDERQGPGSTRTGVDLGDEQTRDIIRRVRTQNSEPPPKRRCSDAMKRRIKEKLQAICEAEQDGRKHLSLTDPDARMMGEGREKRIRECHCFTLAAEDGQVLAADTIQTHVDHSNLIAIVDKADKLTPEGVKQVTADAGYFNSAVMVALAKKGIDLCIPDSNTAADLKRKQPIGTTRSKTTGTVPFTYDPDRDCYHCPEGHELTLRQKRKQGGEPIKVYRSTEPCTDCTRRKECGSNPKAAHRTRKVPESQVFLEQLRKRFEDPEFVKRYYKRAPQIETLFAVLRRILKVDRWQLRGKAGVAAESVLFKNALQLRWLRTVWAA